MAGRLRLVLALAAGGLALLALAFAPASAAVTQTFSFTGAQQNFVVPTGVTSVTITASGAQGGAGNNSGGVGANGGSVTATITVTPGESLAIFVGGAGGGVEVVVRRGQPVSTVPARAVPVVPRAGVVEAPLMCAKAAPR